MATRARGQLPVSMIHQGWPYQVRIVVPDGGFGVSRMQEIHAWLDEHAPGDLMQRAPSVRGKAHVSAWAFTVFETAEAFQVRFGGALTDAGEEDRRRLKWRDPSLRLMSEILRARRR